METRKLEKGHGWEHVFIDGGRADCGLNQSRVLGCKSLDTEEHKGMEEVKG